MDNRQTIMRMFDDNLCSNPYSSNNRDEDHGVMMMKDQVEQERLLPIANVGRIMKQVLPPNAKVSKEAKETMQECVSEFISFVTGEASDKCHKEKRKTVNGDDVCWAMSSLGFDQYSNALTTFLHRYRESEAERANHNKTRTNSEDDEHHNG